MFRKLLKYDLAYVWRWWWIVAVALVGATLLGAFLLRGTLAAAEELQALLAIVCGLYFVPYVLAMGAGTLVTTILLYWRFYSHFFSDQGYLTFTLPVKRRTLLLSKICNELIWHVAQGILLVLCILLFFLIAPPATAEYPVINPMLFQALGNVFSALWEGFGAMLLLYVPALMLLLLCATLFQICLVHFCITVGAVIAKKWKLLAGIGIYYGVNSVLSLATQLLFGLAGGLMFPGLVAILGKCTLTEGKVLFAMLFLLVTLVFLTLSVFFYCITQDKLDHKLNLA